ncbi:MAG: aminotransferase class V-fold PLP-dependent enzyme [Treponema sp.]|jgi:L-cysteine/cystine lyase|nr:aminotransferase class V-fold PLP-dependent enzyme [Treponema sp.]
MGNFQERLSIIRKKLSQREESIYLNTGVIGPLSDPAKLALAEAAFGGKNGFFLVREASQEAKTAVAELLNAAPEEISLKNSTTHGIYEAIFSLNWEKGDEILVSDGEHHAVLRPALQLRERFGVVIKYFKAASAESVSSLKAAITEKTKLAAFSHVSYITGERLDVKALTAAAHAKNVPVLIDGAQSAGAIPVDIKDIGAEYYSIPGQKWLFGPQGTGALFVKKSLWENYAPVVNSEEKPWPYGDEKIFTDIKRWEPVLPSGIGLAAFAASLRWFLNEVGPSDAFGAIKETVSFARSACAGIKGLEVITPENFAGLVSLRVKEKPAKDLLAFLNAKNIFARTVDPAGFLRFSFSYFITEEEVQRLLEEIKNFLR